MIRRAFFLLLLSSGMACAAPSIQPLRESDVRSGCGCSFQFTERNRADKTFLQWIEGEDAFMRIDGRRERFKRVEKADKTVHPRAALGDTRTYLLKNKRYAARLCTRAVQVCGPNEPDCEATGLAATVRLSSPKGRRTVKGRASCRC